MNICTGLIPDKYHYLDKNGRMRSRGQEVNNQVRTDAGRRAARDIILLCTTGHMSAKREERLIKILSGPIDWDYLHEMAESHNVVLLMSHYLISNGFADLIPESSLQRLNQIHGNALYRNIILACEQEKILATETSKKRKFTNNGRAQSNIGQQRH